VIREKTGPSAFRAESGTNIEAALKDIASRVISASSSIETAHVWFFTDGEATVYDAPSGPDSIPKNPKVWPLSSLLSVYYFLSSY
jgi:hypothetical protein